MTNKSFKFVAIVKKGLSPGMAMNTIGHLGLSIVAKCPPEHSERMQFIDYITQDGVHLSSISALPLVVLQGSSKKIKNLSVLAKQSGILQSCFVESMTGDTYVEQLNRTQNIKNDQLEYYGIMLFGEAEKLLPLTKKFSLWR